MLFVLQRELDENWRQLLLVIAFVVLPLLARVFRAVVEKLNGTGRAERTSDEERRARREERRRAESEGEEIWKRLLQGEEEAPVPPRPVPVPEPVRRPSLPEASVPDPLSVLGRAERIPEAALPEAALGEVALAEVSLESTEVAPPLDALARARTDAPTRKERRAPVPRLRLGDRSELARAIVLAEVLGPPLSERR